MSKRQTTQIHKQLKEKRLNLIDNQKLNKKLHTKSKDTIVS